MTLIWLLAVVLIIAGVVKLVNREVLLGAVLIIVGLLLGGGGNIIVR